MPPTPRTSPPQEPQSQRDVIDWPFLAAIIARHYCVHQQRIRLSGDVSCTYLLTSRLAPSEVSHTPDERVVLFAIFGAAGFIADFYLFGRISPVYSMMGSVLREYSRWDRRGRAHLSEAGLDQVHLMLCSVHWVLYVVTLAALPSAPIVAWTSDNGN